MSAFLWSCATRAMVRCSFMLIKFLIFCFRMLNKLMSGMVWRRMLKNGMFSVDYDIARGVKVA